MAKLTILRGLSGSGKSTWAAQQNAAVVSRDSIRVMMYGSDKADYYAVDKDILGERERTVTIIQDRMIEGLLKSGKDVIVDNTNTEWKFVKALAKIGYRCGAEVEVKVFDVSLNEAIARDIQRGTSGGRFVGDIVIKKQHERLSKNKSMTLDPVAPVKPYNGTPGKPKAFIVDIDGTLAHMNDKRGPFDWAKVGLDDVDQTIADIVLVLSEGSFSLGDDWNVIVMSGRDEACRGETEEWLFKHCIPYNHLFMRPKGDMRKDNIVKHELFNEHVRNNFDVMFVLDDRQQVVDMWRRMGLTCLQVAESFD